MSNHSRSSTQQTHTPRDGSVSTNPPYQEPSTEPGMLTVNTLTTNGAASNNIPKGRPRSQRGQNKGEKEKTKALRGTKSNKAGFVSSCVLCDAKDTNEMVACDTCEKWFHFGCVNVTEEISEKSWECAECTKKDKEKGGPSEIECGSKKISSHGSKGNDSRKSDRRSAKLSYLEEKRKLQIRMVEEERKMQESRDRIYLENLKACEANFLLRKLNIDRSSSQSSSSDDIERGQYTSSWIEQHKKSQVPDNQEAEKVPLSQPTRKDKFSEPTACKDHVKINEQINNIHDQSTPQHPQNPESQPHIQSNSTKAQNLAIHNSTIAGMTSLLDPWSNPFVLGGHARRNDTFDVPHSTSRERQSYSEGQIAARLVIGKRDLPEFSGKPGEWPLFISAYTRTTEKCGFTDDENLERLLKALKGEARNLVQARLINSNMVSTVIDTLYRNYGRPDIILDQLIENARSHPPIRPERLDQLLKLSAAVEDLCATLENSLLNDHLNNPVLLKELVRKLPVHFQLSWSFFTEAKEGVNISTFNKWLITIANAASRLPKSQPSDEKSEVKVRRGKERPIHLLGAHNIIEHEPSTSGQSRSSTSCSMCNQVGHSINNCDSFKGLTRNKRYEIVFKRRLCRKCLGRHHTKVCKLDIKCGIDGCTGRHNYLLHSARSDDHPIQKSEPTSSEAARSNHHRSLQNVLYRILPVRLYGKKTIDTYAFLDDGSSVSLVEESIAKELGVDGPTTDLCLKWTGDVSRIESGAKNVNITISGTDAWSKRFPMSGIYTVTNLDLPSQSIQKSGQQHYLKNIPIAEYQNVTPTILIGLDHINLTVPLQVRQGKPDQPVATKTRLGWTLSGPLSKASLSADSYIGVHTCQCSEEALDLLVQSFFTVESLGVSVNRVSDSASDLRARKIMEDTTKLIGSQYETGLLWQNDDTILPDSRRMAEKRLLCLEKKLEKDLVLKENVRRQFREYIQKGYAKELVDDRRTNITWYLPVFTVKHPSKSKVRLVWDAAAKSNGIALNDVLLKGPDLVPRLTDILFKFREKPIAITGDIAEMFHQVKIRQQDQDAQRFLWRDCDTTRRPTTYVMAVMTFGATCSPYSAQYTKNINAERFEKDHPRAVKAIHNNHYVDDYLDSFQNLEEAATVAKDVIAIHAAGGFSIRSWRSNSPWLLRQLGAQINQDLHQFSSMESSADKVLGLSWDTSKDVFVFALNKARIDWQIIHGAKIPSKREILSTVMCIFDPLGLIASYLIYAKVLLQSIWRSGVNWDSPINEEHFKKWKLWVEHLTTIQRIEIPRCYVEDSTERRKYELHIFVDASEVAYAAVAYLCSEVDGIRDTRLICSKTRVAPNKPCSIPRLELLAAVLGARLKKSICEGHSIVFEEIWIWSDSHTVLSWLRTDARSFRQFVGLRVSECLELTSINQWRWVPTKLNVADEATKWARSPFFSSESRWYTGPKFLLDHRDTWPSDPKMQVAVRPEEMRRCLVVQDAGTLVRSPTPSADEFSSWRRLIKVQAIFLRATRIWKTFVKRHKNDPRENIRGSFSREEWEKAKTCLILKAQWDIYSKDIVRIINNDLEETSPIFQYSPNLDDNGVIRMEGRIDEAEGIPESMKNPPIMPENHKYTALLVNHFHVKFNHLNHETVINELRQRYVIPKVRVLLKKVRNKCQFCRNRAARPIPPMMGSLPRERLEAYRRPFSYVGVDYFGPIEVKVGSKVEKRYGALFTCATTRAIHLEVAQTLSSDSCIKCVIRFMARRGTPIQILSDNGTNFRGATNELRRLLKTLPTTEIAAKFPDIEWIFIPPGAPHFGGIWERLVQSVKTNIQLVLRGRRPNDDTLYTSFTEIENIINSRPLTHVQLETSDQEAITPNHILLGASDGRKPFFIPENDQIHYTHQWKSVQQIAQSFWRRWVTEYLPTLVRRTKWFQPVGPLQVGDVVLLVDQKSPYNSWPKGMVQDVIRSRDGQVRTAVVKIGSQFYTRPAVKLAKLDVKGKDQNEADKPLQDGSFIGGENVTTLTN